MTRTVSKSSGFTMVEVLVALVVLSVGLLGLAMLQVQGLKNNTDSYFRTQATIMAYDIIDRMRANKAGANLGLYVASAKPGTVEACGTGTTGCSTDSALANFDLSQWYANLETALPLGTSTIASAGNQHTITITWTERGIPKSRQWVIEL